jgi:Zn-dependent peptidase ImmA (M78 family)
MESSLIQPSDAILAKIARTTTFPVEFFRRPPREAVPLGSLLFRAKASASGRDFSQAHRWGQLLIECYDDLAIKYERPVLRVPILSGERPSHAAALARSAIGLGPDLPIPNVTYALEQAGVKIVACPVSLSGRSAFSTWVGERTPEPVIVVSKEEAGDRLRFSEAHELGHLVLHFGRGGGRIRAIEQEANDFASAFLMPQAAMLAELTLPVTLRSLALLKPRWGVSLQALVMRAKHLGVITTRRARSLFQELNARGLRMDEGAELAVAVERPRLFRKMAELRYGAQIDVRRFAAEANIHPTDMSAIVNAHATAADLRSVVKGRKPRNIVAFRSSKGRGTSPDRF